MPPTARTAPAEPWRSSIARSLALRLRAMRISYTSRKRCWIVGSLRSASGVPSNWMRPWSIT